MDLWDGAVSSSTHRQTGVCSGGSVAAVGTATPEQATNGASATWHQAQALGVFFWLFSPINHPL